MLLFSRTRKIFHIAIALLLLSFSFNMYTIQSDPVATFFSPLTRFWELLIGSILAFVMLEKKGSGIIENRKNIISCCGALLLALGFLLITETKSFPGSWALLPTIGAALLIMAGPGAWINSKILSNRMFVWFGLISYPLYLWHWPMLTFARIFEGTFREISDEKRIFAVVLSILLAWATYKFIEKPIRFGEHKKVATIALAGAMIVVGAFGFSIYAQDGYQGRIKFSPEKASVLFQEYPHPKRNENCEKTYVELKDSWSCLLSKPKPADVAIIGDSHAHQYYQSFAKALSAQSVLNFSAPGCFPFVSEAHLDAPCKKKQAEALEFLAKHKTIKTVYLTGYFSYLSAGGFKNGNIEGLREAQPLESQQAQTFIANGKSIIQALLDEGKDVVIINDIPDVIFKPISRVEFESKYLNYIRANGQADIKKSSNECAIDKKTYEIRNKPYETALQDIIDAFPNVRVFDTRTVLCDEEVCWIVRNGVPLYWNSDHLTLEGTDMIADSLFQSTSNEERF